MTFATWAQQPTTVAGFAAVVSSAIALATGGMSLAAGIPVIVGGVIGMVLNDNTKAVADAKALTLDAMALASGGVTMAKIEPALTDAIALAGDVSPSVPKIPVAAIGAATTLIDAATSAEAVAKAAGVKV